jgi:uncharacterized membrane protein
VLSFHNSTFSWVWVMIEFYHPNCPDGGNWMKSGWWPIGSEDTGIVHGANVSAVNRFWYYYAHDGLGGEWAGEFQETVPPTEFERCATTSSTADRTIGMREIDVGNAANFTINLTP